MNKKTWSILLVSVSLLSWYFPKWNGIFAETTFDITSGEGRIVASILFVGGLILWYLPEQNSKNNTRA